MKWLLLVLLLLVFFAGQTTGQNALSLEITSDQETYEAQDRGVLHLAFTNNTGYKIEEIEVSVTSDDFIFYTKEVSIESILWGPHTVNLKFHCRSLEDGEYPVHISYNYLATSKSCSGGICQSVQDRKTHYITIENGKPHVSLEKNVLTAVDDKTVITFKNSNEVAIDFTFEIISDLKLQYESYVGYLLTISSKQIEVEGPPGEYEGSVKVRYRDRFGREYEKTFLLRIVIEEREPVKPEYTKQQIRTIDINTASAASSPSTSSARGTPVSQYYVYFVVFSCLSLIGVAAAAKLRNLKNGNGA